MCDLCVQREKVASVAEKTLFSMVDSSHIFAKASSYDKWEKKPNDNPFMDHKKITKRAKRYAKGINEKTFKVWRKRFKANFAQIQDTPNLLLWLGGSFFVKKEFTRSDRDKVLQGVVEINEITDAMDRAFVEEELSVSFKEAIKNTSIVMGNDVDEGAYEMSQVFTDQYRKFNLELSTKLGQTVKDKIQSIVTYGLEDGKSTRQIGKDIRMKFDRYTKYEAERIARTETIRASARGTMSAYEELGIEKYEILPAQDACPICKDLEANNPYSIKDASARPPIHPNCRCSVIPVLQDIISPKAKSYEDEYMKDFGDATEKADSKIQSYISKNSRGMTYAEAKSITDYTRQQHYSKLNSEMRGLSERSGKYELMEKVMTNAIKKADKFEGNLYRGMSFNSDEDFDRFIGGLKKGKSFSDGAFMSTSKDVDVAKSFLEGKKNILLEIKGVTGYDISDLNMLSENEIVVNKGTNLIVDSIDLSGPNAKVTLVGGITKLVGIMGLFLRAMQQYDGYYNLRMNMSGK